MALALIALGCAACATVEQASTDPRLLRAQSAFDEGQRLREAGHYAEAIPLIEQAQRLREEVLTGTHPKVADCINLLGEAHVLLADYARAESLLTRALQMREATLGDRHPDVARSLNNLAALSFLQGHYTRAETLSERALQIQEAALGNNHPDVAESLNNLAAFYHSQGRYRRAEPLYERAIAIWEATRGAHDPNLANSLNNLAQLYVSRGLYSRAEPLYSRALQIREAALGAHHPDVALSLQSLAQLYTSQGLYARAQPLFERALQIREAALGANHPDVALSLTNLAVLYHHQGLYARAESLHERALQIREAALGANHPDVAHSLTNLAAFYADQGLYARAEPLQLRALQIREASLGSNHPDVARALHKLGALYDEQGLYARAEPLYLRAIEIGESTLGAKHPDIADWLSNLAHLYAVQGLSARAQPLYERALTIQKATLGEHHPSVVYSLHRTALLRVAQQQLDEALPLFQQAFAASEEHLRQEIFGLSERHLATFLHLLRAQEAELHALVRAHPDDSRVRQLALTTALLRKGRSVQEVAHLSHIIYRYLDKADRETFERLRVLRTEFATLSLTGPGNLSPTDYQQRLKDLSHEGDVLEADLARRSEPLRSLQALPSRDELLPRLSAALPSDGALIEFVAYQDRPLVPMPGLPPAQVPSHLRYLALLLFPDGHTRAVDLGPAEPIDRAALRLQEALAQQSTSYLPAAQALYTLAFRPLVPHLRKAQRLFLTPDGQLNLVPFAALHDGKRFLVDSFHITYLTSGKDLLPRFEKLPSRPSVVVLADPDFGSTATAVRPAAPTEPELAQRSTALDRLLSTLRSAEADIPWTPLPGTRAEAQAIHRLFPQAQLLLGPDATKQALLNLPTPGLLHIATHGFFLEDAPSSPNSRAVGHFGAVGASLPEVPGDPLLRSGLVLAGFRSSAVPPGSHHPEDSLVTALELAGLNLWGTQLVVLSACDTGRGAVSLGEGVYGLRRAFLVAGAETLVTSLWKVNDEMTAQLMARYYRHLLAGLGRTAALRQAMREFRRTHPHPHFWAPFIPIGRDAPLLVLEPSPPTAPAP